MYQVPVMEGEELEASLIVYSGDNMYIPCGGGGDTKNGDWTTFPLSSDCQTKPCPSLYFATTW